MQLEIFNRSRGIFGHLLMLGLEPKNCGSTVRCSFTFKERIPYLDLKAARLPLVCGKSIKMQSIVTGLKSRINCKIEIWSVESSWIENWRFPSSKNFRAQGFEPNTRFEVETQTWIFLKAGIGLFYVHIWIHRTSFLMRILDTDCVEKVTIGSTLWISWLLPANDSGYVFRNVVYSEWISVQQSRRRKGGDWGRRFYGVGDRQWGWWCRNRDQLRRIVHSELRGPVAT